MSVRKAPQDFRLRLAVTAGGRTAIVVLWQKAWREADAFARVSQKLMRQGADQVRREEERCLAASA